MESLNCSIRNRPRSKVIAIGISLGIIFLSIVVLITWLFVCKPKSDTEPLENHKESIQNSDQRHIKNSILKEDGNNENAKKIVGGYFWAGALRVIKIPEELNPQLLTHIYYAFLDVQSDGSLRIQNEERAIKLKLPILVHTLKERNKNLKILFSCVGKENFSIVAADENKRRIFVLSALEIIEKWDYDGLDLDWEFPRAADKENFVLLLKELKQEFQKHNYILAAAVRAIPIYEGTGYNVVEISKYLDVINIMTYDFFGAWSSHTGFNAPLYPSSLDSPYEKKFLSVQAALTNWLEAGAPKHKICLGIPFYGKSFTLKDANINGIHAPVTGAGKSPSATYYKIMVSYKDWPTVWNEEQQNSYKYNGDQWIGYDDKRSVVKKTQFALEQDIAGVFVWHLGGDDLSGDASDGYKQFLLSHIYLEIIKKSCPSARTSTEVISTPSISDGEDAPDVSEPPKPEETSN